MGGNVKGKGRGHRGNKSMVLSAIQRGGNIRLRVDQRPDRETLHAFIRAHTKPGAERIMTDEWAAYPAIASETTKHETVNHKAEEWVRGDVHTNTMEGAFSLFKRGHRTTGRPSQRDGLFHHSLANRVPQSFLRHDIDSHTQQIGEVDP